MRVSFGFGCWVVGISGRPGGGVWSYRVEACWERRYVQWLTPVDPWLRGAGPVGACTCWAVSSVCRVRTLARAMVDLRVCGPDWAIGLFEGLGMAKLAPPILTMLLVSLLAPSIWLVMAFSNMDRFRSGLLSERYLEDYLVISTLMYWLGSLPVSVATWMLWRRASGGAIPALIISMVLILGLVGLLAALSLPFPNGCLMFCPPAPHKVREISFVVAWVLAVFSLPVWIHWGVLQLADARRRYRTRVFDR